MKRRIHVNQHIIRSNRKNNEREPVLTVKTYKSNDYCHEAIIEPSIVTGKHVSSSSLVPLLNAVTIAIKMLCGKFKQL